MTVVTNPLVQRMLEKADDLEALLTVCYLTGTNAFECLPLPRRHIQDRFIWLLDQSDEGGLDGVDEMLLTIAVNEDCDWSAPWFIEVGEQDGATLYASFNSEAEAVSYAKRELFGQWWDLVIYDIDSSAIEAAAYDPKRGWLYLTWTGGRDYTYFGVPYHVANKLRTVESVGRYVNYSIKDHYHYESGYSGLDALLEENKKRAA